MPVREELVQRIYRGRNPYDGFLQGLTAPDLQGWNSQHPFLAQSIDDAKPGLVIEIGVWKGASCATMARRMKSRSLDAAILAIDTWLGSWEHWAQDGFFHDLSLEFGHPKLYQIFLTNMLSEELDNYVVPLPLDSANAAQLVARLELRPQVIHIDASHDYDAALSDLKRWWSLLENNGILVVDDYDSEGKVWPSVGQAVDDFATTLDHFEFEVCPNKCRFMKRS